MSDLEELKRKSKETRDKLLQVAGDDKDKKRAAQGLIDQHTDRMLRLGHEENLDTIHRMNISQMEKMMKKFQTEELVKHYKSILKELTSMEDLVKQRGEAGALEQAKRDRERLDTYLKTRKPSLMTPEKIERFTAIANTRLPSLSSGPETITIDRDKANRQVSAYNPTRVPAAAAFTTRTPKESDISSAAIWLPGRNTSADATRQFAHTRVDDLRKLARKGRPPIVKPPTPPDA